MRLDKFAVPSALNYVSEDRINQFKTSETVARHTVIRRIDEASLTADTRTQLNDLIDSFGQSVDEMLELFEKKSFRRYCTSNGSGVSPQKLRNRLVRNRNAAMKNNPVSRDAPLELRPLQNKHWKCVLLHAADIALGYWTSAQARTLIKLREKLLHDILKYPPNDIKFDPPEGGVERYFYNDEKVEDHGFRCSSQRRFKNHDHNRMPSSCAATCS